SNIKSLEKKGYFQRLNKKRETFRCRFAPGVIEVFAPKPLDPAYYKIVCLYLRSLGSLKRSRRKPSVMRRGKGLTSNENSVARAVAEKLAGPEHLARVSIDQIAQTVDMSTGGVDEQIRLGLRPLRVLSLIKSPSLRKRNTHGHRRTNCYRFTGVA